VTSRVWYASYGSNMAAARLACYVQGGCPPGGSRVNPGARDRTLPARSAPVDLPGTLYFAGESPQWGGGVAFYDHDRPGFTAARAFLLTPGQLADITAQEMYRLPVDGDPLEEVLLGPLDGGRHSWGPGRYETLVEVGRLEGSPVVTFTSPHGAAAVEHTRPAPAYLQTMAIGLHECRGWDEGQIASYLGSVVPVRFGA